MGAAGVKRLMRLGMVEKVPGMGALDMNTGERRGAHLRSTIHAALRAAGAAIQWVVECR